MIVISSTDDNCAYDNYKQITNKQINNYTV